MGESCLIWTSFSYMYMQLMGSHCINYVGFLLHYALFMYLLTETCLNLHETTSNLMSSNTWSKPYPHYNIYAVGTEAQSTFCILLFYPNISGYMHYYELTMNLS